MAVREALSENTELGNFSLRQLVVSNLEQFCQECDRFIKWQYQEIIKGAPSRETQENHRRELKWTLRTAKLLECVASDPDSSSPAALSLLRAKLWQLERSWKMLYDPMPEHKADGILREVFPDAPRA
jgi:hypothetical protein